MNSVAEDQNDSSATVRFTSGVSLRDFLSEDGAIFEIKHEDFMREETADVYDQELFDYTNLECLGLDDEDTYNETEPFANLANKMTKLREDGKIKKRILREGIGTGLFENGYVTVDYNAFIEYSPTPFDSTYARNRPFKFRLDEGQTLPGLEIAIKSMKVSEKSQFLIHPDLAYGKMGCLKRVPPDTEVLFEIEVKNCLNTGAATSFNNLTKEEKQSFTKAYEFAQAACIQGKTYFEQNLLKQALKKYNEAISSLENCTLADYKDQEQQQELLLRLYTNLVVVYTKLQVPRKACTSANEIFRLVKGTNLKVPAKVYFNNARSLRMLGDYENAKRKLTVAKKMSPTDSNITEEFLILEKLMKENHTREQKLAKAVFKKEDNKEENITEEFKETLKEYFNELNNDTNNLAYNLPHELNQEEINYIKANAPQFNLKFGENNGRCYIYKELKTSDE